MYCFPKAADAGAIPAGVNDTNSDIIPTSGSNPVSGYVGYVTRFQVDAAYLSKFDLKQVGGKSHTEYWIPANLLEEFNNWIVGTIQIAHRFTGTQPLRKDFDQN